MNRDNQEEVETNSCWSWERVKKIIMIDKKLGQVFVEIDQMSKKQTREVFLIKSWYQVLNRRNSTLFREPFSWKSLASFDSKENIGMHLKKTQYLDINLIFFKDLYNELINTHSLSLAFPFSSLFLSILSYFFFYRYLLLSLTSHVVLTTALFLKGLTLLFCSAIRFSMGLSYSKLIRAFDF